MSHESAAPPSGRPISRAEQARALGVSERRLYQMLAAERAGAAEWVHIDPPDGPPYVPIGDGPGTGRYRYDLAHDQSSRLPLGLMRIATGPSPARDRAGAGGGRAAGPGRLEGRLAIRHYNEQLSDPRPRAAGKKKPKAPPAKKLTREEVDAIRAKHDRPRRRAAR